uniref:LAGLIDADG endonuclease n=1 Tax=Daedaleopsis nitida TaxID=1140402 RepID=UPI0030E4BF69
MLGGADKIPGKSIDSIRFNIEQSISNTAYINYLTLLFYKLGYCARPFPTLVEKSEKIIENRFNYRLTLFTFTSFIWIYDSYYKTIKGVPSVTFFYFRLFITSWISSLDHARWLI